MKSGFFNEVYLNFKLTQCLPHEEPVFLKCGSRGCYAAVETSVLAAAFSLPKYAAMVDSGRRWPSGFLILAYMKVSTVSQISKPTHNLIL